MLQVFLERNELGIPKRFEAAIIAFVCIRFVLSNFQLEENRISVYLQIHSLHPYHPSDFTQ